MKKDYEVVFVQLGKAKAEHLWKSISLIQDNWPNMKLRLITDSTEHKRRATKIGITVWEYVPSQELSELMSRSSHNNDFRDGFWNYSILRLFAILDYSNTKPTTALIHLESDITVFPNFPFDQLAGRPLPTWLSFNETHDVGSIFTIPGVEAAQWLRKTFMEELQSNPSLTDMTLLNRISRKSPELMEFLPVASDLNDIFIRSTERATLEGEKICRSFTSFGGIFDSAPIGMWLLGQDPRNHLGRIMRYRALEESYIQPQLIDFSFDSDTQTLATSAGAPIFNLHVHSKELSYFDNRRPRRIKNRVNESRTLSKASIFDVKAFYAMAKDYIKRNGVLATPRKIRTFFKTFP